MRQARQQKGEIGFSLINRIDVPVALASLGLLVALLGRAIWLRDASDLTTFAAVVTCAIFLHALISGAIAGPHDSYGARMAWLSTLVILIAGLRRPPRVQPRNGYRRHRSR
jgi:hypothetical protein